MWPIDRPPHWVGRTQELVILRAGAEALRRGEGGVVWVEGEPGIGKSSLVAEALAEAGDPEWDVGWGVADHLTEQLPLRPMLDCLQLRPGRPHPDQLRPGEPGLPPRRPRTLPGTEGRDPPGHAGAGRDLAATRR